MAHSPAKVIFVREAPNPRAKDAFESVWHRQPGFLTLRYVHIYAFIEFRDVESAAAAMDALQGHKYHPDAPPLSLDFDRDAGRPTKRKRGPPVGDPRDPRGDPRGDPRDAYIGYPPRGGPLYGGYLPPPHSDSYYPEYRGESFRAPKRGRYEPPPPGGDRYLPPYESERDRYPPFHPASDRYISESGFERPRERESDRYVPAEAPEPQRTERRSEGRALSSSGKTKKDKPERSEKSEKSEKKTSSEHKSKSDKTEERSKPKEGHSSRRATTPEDERPPPPPPRSYTEPYEWMNMFLPYWQTTGNIPFDPLGRMERHRRTLGQSSKTLFLKNLPEDITTRELTFLFAFLPNFSSSRVITKSDFHGRKLSMGFVDFADAASAYVAMTCMQGYYFGDFGLHIEYDRFPDNGGR